jgi:hypothetical protein
MPVIDQAVALLEALGDELGRRQWTARLQVTPGRPPCLHVQNPAAPALSERIYAGPRADGMWLWWPWAAAVALRVAADRRPVS